MKLCVVVILVACLATGTFVDSKAAKKKTVAKTHSKRIFDSIADAACADAIQVQKSLTALSANLAEAIKSNQTQEMVTNALQKALGSTTESLQGMIDNVKYGTNGILWAVEQLISSADERIDSTLTKFLSTIVDNLADLIVKSINEDGGSVQQLESRTKSLKYQEDSAVTVF